MTNIWCLIGLDQSDALVEALQSICEGGFTICCWPARFRYGTAWVIGILKVKDGADAVMVFHRVLSRVYFGGRLLAMLN